MSTNSYASNFVELEWTTALALRNPILPCRLDGTPLPASLSALQAVDARQALQTLNIGPPAGQNLSGTVWDEHNQPVAGARVVIIETGQTAMTGPSGAFQFSLRREKG